MTWRSGWVPKRLFGEISADCHFVISSPSAIQRARPRIRWRHRSRNLCTVPVGVLVFVVSTRQHKRATEQATPQNALSCDGARRGDARRGAARDEHGRARRPTGATADPPAGGGERGGPGAQREGDGRRRPTQQPTGGES